MNDLDIEMEIVRMKKTLRAGLTTGPPALKDSRDRPRGQSPFSERRGWGTEPSTERLREAEILPAWSRGL